MQAAVTIQKTQAYGLYRATAAGSRVEGIGLTERAALASLYRRQCVEVEYHEPFAEESGPQPGTAPLWHPRSSFRGVPERRDGSVLGTKQSRGPSIYTDGREDRAWRKGRTERQG